LTLVPFVLPSGKQIEIDEYLDPSGRSPFARWMNKLNVPAATVIHNRLERLAGGNRSNVKSVGAGVFEIRIDFGPGYRIYFGNDGERLVILLAGGSKARQSEDIAAAKARWTDYRTRKPRRANAIDKKL